MGRIVDYEKTKFPNICFLARSVNSFFVLSISKNRANPVFQKPYSLPTSEALRSLAAAVPATGATGRKALGRRPRCWLEATLESSELSSESTSDSKENTGLIIRCSSGYGRELRNGFLSQRGCVGMTFHLILIKKRILAQSDLKVFPRFLE